MMNLGLLIDAFPILPPKQNLQPRDRDEGRSGDCAANGVQARLVLTALQPSTVNLQWLNMGVGGH